MKDEELSFDDRRTMAVKEIEAICKKYKLDILPILVQVGKPDVSGISLVVQLSFIDLKNVEVLSAPKQEQTMKN